MTNLQLALKRFRERPNFHDETRLEAIIAAVREEEQKNFAKLIEAAKVIVSNAK